MLESSATKVYNYIEHVNVIQDGGLYIGCSTHFLNNLLTKTFCFGGKCFFPQLWSFPCNFRLPVWDSIFYDHFRCAVS